MIQLLFNLQQKLAVSRLVCDLRDDERDRVDVDISVKAEALEAGPFEQSIQKRR